MQVLFLNYQLVDKGACLRGLQLLLLMILVALEVLEVLVVQGIHLVHYDLVGLVHRLHQAFLVALYLQRHHLVQIYLGALPDPMIK